MFRSGHVFAKMSGSGGALETDVEAVTAAGICFKLLVCSALQQLPAASLLFGPLLSPS